MGTNLVSDYSAALDFLMRRINYERTLSVPYRTAEFKLDRMRRLLGMVGDPHLGLKAVHIAGTKGKGSTAAMLASVLQSAGYRTGLYTSPHLDRIEERIAIDGQICPPAEFAALAGVVQPAVEQLDRESAPPGMAGATFFEVTTAMAFLHFARRGVQIAVLEVGLGGRLDSTNVCVPEVCLITNISLDHVKQLGSTLAAIAGEKAGIIKPGVPVVSGVLTPEPRDVIAQRAAALGSPLFQRGESYDFSQDQANRRSPLTIPHEIFDYREPANAPQYRLPNISLGLLGQHQAANAAGAICAVNRLRERGWSISDDALRQGLAAARCSGRMEQVCAAPTVILDVAHNVASVAASLAVLCERFSGRKRIGIFASSKDKDYAGMLRLVLPAFDVIFLTQYVNNPRAMEAEGLLEIALQLRRDASPGSSQSVLHAAVQPAFAWRLAKAMATPDDLICITGSFFLAAELRPLIVTPECAGQARPARQ